MKRSDLAEKTILVLSLDRTLLRATGEARDPADLKPFGVPAARGRTDAGLIEAARCFGSSHPRWHSKKD